MCNLAAVGIVTFGFSAVLSGARFIIAVFPTVFSAALGIGVAQIGVPFLDLEIGVMKDGHVDHLIPLAEFDAAHPGRTAARKDTAVGDGETDALAKPGGQQSVFNFVACMHPDQAVILFELHGDLAVGHDIGEIGKAITADIAAGGGEHDEHVSPAFLVFGQRHQGGDGFTL